MSAGGDILRLLLPSGDAWPRSAPELVRDQVLDGLGLSYDRVRRRALNLVEESDPRSACPIPARPWPPPSPSASAAPTPS